MILQPDSEIHILSTDLTNEYKHTYSHTAFGDKNGQTDFFLSKVRFGFIGCTPVKLNQQIKVELSQEDLFDCNYLMFKNSRFADKWIYAFITNVDYVNPNICLITYDIDVIQTFLYDFSFNECFIERQHAWNDEIGQNTIPENLDFGDWIGRDIQRSGYLNIDSIVLAASVNTLGEPSEGALYCGIYSGLEFSVFNISQVDEVNAALARITAAGASDGIVSIFMMPSSFISLSEPVPKTYDISFQKYYSNIDGYTPKNNKLYVYPYNFLYVTNLDTSAVFPYEYFKDDFVCHFLLAGDFNTNPSVLLAPKYYKGLDVNYDEKMVIDGFPQCPYITDTFKAYLAQNAGGLITGALSQGVNLLGSLALGSPIGVTNSAVSIAQSIGNLRDKSVQPPQAKGGGNSTSMSAMDLKDFFFINKQIRHEYAVIIDEYFSTYGYKTLRFEKPNIHSRLSWNYIQTQGCHVKSSNSTENIPFIYASQINNIHDNGITYWHGDFLGDYSRANYIE